MKEAIENLSRDIVLRKVKEAVERLGTMPEIGIEIVCKACCDNPALAPSYRRSRSIQSDEQAIQNWVKRFYQEYYNRPSVREGRPPQTKVDPAVLDIIGQVCKRNDSAVRKIEYAHRLAMSADKPSGSLSGRVHLRAPSGQWLGHGLGQDNLSR